jgi:hypothetical protein
VVKENRCCLHTDLAAQPSGPSVAIWTQLGLKANSSFATAFGPAKASDISGYVGHLMVLNCCGVIIFT